MKLRTFGTLRMYFMNIGRNLEKMRAYLKANYTPTEQERISAAFKTIGKDNEVPGGTGLLDE